MDLVHSSGHFLVFQILLHSFRKIFSPFSPVAFRSSAGISSIPGLLFYFIFLRAADISDSRMSGSSSNVCESGGALLMRISCLYKSSQYSYHLVFFWDDSVRTFPMASLTTARRVTGFVVISLMILCMLRVLFDSLFISISLHFSFRKLFLFCRVDLRMSPVRSLITV